MSQRSNSRLNKETTQSIKQMDESKQMDAVQKQLGKNTYCNYSEYKQMNKDPSDSIKQYFRPKNSFQNKEKYFTNQQSQTKKRSVFTGYHSGGLQSTQPASPYNKFQTQSNFKFGQKSEVEQMSIKKKLFHHQQKKNSPSFNLRQSKFEDFSLTFKKKIGQYERQFNFDAHTSQNKEQLKFQRLDFELDRNAQTNTNQNDPLRLNLSNESSSQSVKKRLNFQSLSLKQQNPIIREINEQLRRDRVIQDKKGTYYLTSRRNQSDLIKRKILESKSDLSRFYQNQGHNVQYQYRKAKFMDIFIGSKLIENDIR